MCSCPSEHSAHSAAKTAPATRRGARPSRQAGAVFAQYPSSRRTAVARSGAVFAQYPSSRRTAVARSGAVFAQYPSSRRTAVARSGAVFAQYPSSRRTAVARSGAVFAEYPSSRRTAVARRRCCVCTVSFVAAHGRRAKAVLCLHSILRRGPRLSREGGAVFAQYPSSRCTAVARRRCCVCTVSVAEHGHCEAGAGLHSIRRRGTRPLPLLCLRSIARGARPLRETSAVFAQYPSSVAGHGHCAKAVLCSHSILHGGARRSGEGGAVFAQYPSWRRTAIGRRRCCVRTVSFVAAHGHRAKAVLCLHVFCTVS